MAPAFRNTHAAHEGGSDTMTLQPSLGVDPNARCASADPIEAQRPTPQPSDLTQPFWSACAQHRLLVQRCDDCGHYVFIPSTFCSACLSTSLRWVESSGVGEIITWTTVWRPQTPAFEVPYVVAVVRLKEGYEMVTNIVGSPPEALEFGQAVEVQFVDISPTVALPCFQVAQ